MQARLENGCPFCPHFSVGCATRQQGRSYDQASSYRRLRPVEWPTSLLCGG